MQIELQTSPYKEGKFMENVIERYKDLEILESKDLERCRDLYGELMALQKSKAFMSKESFDLLSFDARKKGYESTQNSSLLLAEEKGMPVGYVFSVVEEVGDIHGPFPAWAPPKNSENDLGFFPDWENLPPKVGCLSNLYIRNAYRGTGLGSRLFDLSMKWFETLPEIDLVFIYISNGNDAAFDFYRKKGFTYSHEVFGGFIKAVYRYI